MSEWAWISNVITLLLIYLMTNCTGLFGPYGPYSLFDHYHKDHKPHPFVVKSHEIRHIPHKGARFKFTHKHFINKTALCALKGGECSEPINCLGMQQFFCDSYTTTCCFNRTKHVKFRKKHRIRDFINKTALCIAKGGICSGARTCFGSQQFTCADQTETCCFNHTTDELIIKKIIYPQKVNKPFRKPRKRKKFPYLPKPHPLRIQNFIFTHRHEKSGPFQRRFHPG